MLEKVAENQSWKISLQSNYLGLKGSIIWSEFHRGNQCIQSKFACVYGVTFAYLGCLERKSFFKLNETVLKPHIFCSIHTRETIDLLGKIETTINQAKINIYEL